MDVMSACDPLNVVGILTPGARVPATLGNRVVFRDGIPLASLENGVVVNRSNADDATLAQLSLLLRHQQLPIAEAAAETPAAD